MRCPECGDTATSWKQCHSCPICMCERCYLVHPCCHVCTSGGGVERPPVCPSKSRWRDFTVEQTKQLKAMMAETPYPLWPKPWKQLTGGHV